MKKCKNYVKYFYIFYFLEKNMKKILFVLLYILWSLYLIWASGLIFEWKFLAWFISFLAWISVFPIVYQKIKEKIPSLNLKVYIFCSFMLFALFSIVISPKQENIETKKEISTWKIEEKKEEIKEIVKNYSIIRTNHNNAVQNFAILIESWKSKEELIEIFKQVKNNECSKNCNIKLYDSSDLYDLVFKYPLEKNEYLKVADHFVGALTFDLKEEKNFLYYPFQDIQYKEYGWKNWKK